MKYFFVKFKKQLLRLGAVVLIFGMALLVLLYFLGYYDLSFLDRYKVLGELFSDPPANSTSSFFDPSTLNLNLNDLPDPRISSDDTTPTPSVPTPVSDGSEDALEGYTYYENKSVKSVFDSAKLPDKLLTSSSNGAKTVAELLESGYHTVGVSYSEAGLRFVPPAQPEPTGDGEKAEPAETVEAVPAVVTGVYTPKKTILAKLTFSFQLPTSYSLRKRLVEHKVINYPSDGSETYVTTQNVRENRPAVELYMGYILLDNGRNLSVIASDATPLCSINGQIYHPAYLRDRYDRPLFYRNRAGANEEKIYFYLGTNGLNFIGANYDPVADDRGLRFDYPASYGKSDSNITTDKNDVSGRMAYVVKGVGMLTMYNFTRAYAFTENRAAVTTTYNRGGMYFLDENGKQAFQTWVYYFNEHGRDAYANLMPPLTNGIESIGFYYFDHGLTRVRHQSIDAYPWLRRRVRIMRDEDGLIRADGSEYDLPAGYKLEGYSDGMILLSKGGRYGFMDYTGEWIAQPIYTAATPFVCGLATLTTEDGRTGMIDTEGNIVLQFTYDYISQVSDGLIATYREENGWVILKMMEQE